MKKILIATDFSDNAKHAAEYGYAIADQIRTNVVLCNAFIVPAEMPQAGTMVWPQYEYEELVKDTNDELRQLKHALEKKNQNPDFMPSVRCVSETGTVGSIINSVAKAEDIQMIVMGTHGKGKLDTLLLGNHSRSMIDETKHPLLLVPSGIAIQPIKKIAFATDLKEPEKDLKAIAELIPVLKKLQAELLLTHIYNGDDPTFSFKKYVEHSLAELSNKTGYSEIHYRIIKSDNTERGLDWLCEHGHIDVLAMLHHKQGFLDKILLGSHAKKMAEHISIPLLIIPTT